MSEPFLVMILPKEARSRFGRRIWKAMMVYMHIEDGEWPEDSPFPLHVLQNMHDAILAYEKMDRNSDNSNP